MTKLFFLALAIVTLSSCVKETCMSCIAESHSGIIVDYIIKCDKSSKFLKGYADGQRVHYKENGDTVVVHCIYGQ